MVLISKRAIVPLVSHQIEGCQSSGLPRLDEMNFRWIARLVEWDSVRIAPFQSRGCHISEAAATSKLSKFWFKFTHFPPCSVHSAASWWTCVTMKAWGVAICVVQTARQLPPPRSNLSSSSHKDKLPGIAPDLGENETKFHEFDFKKLHEITWNYMKLMTCVLHQMDCFIWKRQRIYSLYHSILFQVLES